MKSPLLQREGVVTEGQGTFVQFKALMEQGVPVPTNHEWRAWQISNKTMIHPKERCGIQEIDGVKYGVDYFNGVEVVFSV